MFKKRAWPTTPKDSLLLGRVFGVLTILRLLLPCVKLNRILGWLAPPQIPPVADLCTLQKTARYVDGLLRRLPAHHRGICLPRSLALYHFATRCGFPVQFHCGVRRVEGQLQGHAWLSLHGKSFLESGDPSQIYAITFSFPDAKPARGHVASPASDVLPVWRSLLSSAWVQEAPPPSVLAQDITTRHNP